VDRIGDGDPAAKAAILSTVDQLFEAMSRRDAAACAELLLGDGTATVMVEEPEQWRLSRRGHKVVVDGIAAGKGVPIETYWEPTVLVRGPIAVVWAPYRFEVDGVESHRGIDVFDMVLIDGRWRIASSMWTKEKGEDLSPGTLESVRPASLRERSTGN
jgi:hypothetical protein